jgi:phage tail-like protein
MALTDSSKIGLANRFHAVATGGYDLGSWYKVDGLDVSWDVADFRVGDQGNHRWYFPANNKYSTVKMQRAATGDDSPKVREWLNKTSFNFQLGTIVTITLGDSALAQVMEWELRNVMPSKWSINTFDANGSAVAIETLELVHEGFLDDQQMFS